MVTTADFKKMIPSAEYTKKLQFYGWTKTPIECNQGLNKPRIHMKRDQATKKNRLLLTELNGSAKQHLFC